MYHFEEILGIFFQLKKYICIFKNKKKHLFLVKKCLFLDVLLSFKGQIQRFLAHYHAVLKYQHES